MVIIKNGFSIGEQSDGSLVYPSGDILLPEQREIIISNSLSTPVRGSESEIKDIIRNASNSILIGETGSGKTTELAQMIHEVYPKDLIITNIPLVAATIGTGSYVSDIMFAKTGNPYYVLGQGGVGYRTGKGVSEEKRTQITFNTYGLDYLNLSLGNFEAHLNGSSKNIHIILDEIHEKGEDFVFYLTKVLDFSKRFPGRIKLYGASATVSENYLDKLVEKFKTVSKEIPITKVEGRTFPINTVEDNGGDIVERVCSFYKDGKSILVFQPGKAEINKTIAAIQNTLGTNISIYPFHSEVSSDELKRNLESSEEQKIFVATNAARTGITLDINVVADSGVQKNQYYNEYGIPVLVSEAITQDAYHQNKGRAGRKEEGDAVYFGHIPLSELEEEAPSSVEIKVDEKKILMELLDNKNILRNENSGIHNYLFNPNKRMLTFSYEWMKKCGLITEDERITKYGYEALKLPLSVFNARIILEAIENNIAGEIVTIVSIIENKGFIKRNFDIAKFAQNLFDVTHTDLDLYKKLFDILSSKEIDDNILNVFVNMGIERSLVNYFKSLKGEEKFYKVIGDVLEEIGLKFKNIERIDETNEKILKYLNSNKEYLNSTKANISESELRELISKCLLSGNLHKIYSSTGHKILEDFYGEQKGLVFEQSDTSFVTINDGASYIGEPFIIGGTGEKDDLAILSFLTSIDIGDIDLYLNRQYELFIPQKEKIRKEKFSIDESGDTFETHNSLLDPVDKQKYLSINWLPYYLVEKNPVFVEFIKNVNGDFDKDIFIQLLQTHTLKHHSKINPDDKEETINLFTNDTTILEGFIKSENPQIKKFLKGEKIEKVVQSEVEGKKSDFLQLIESQNEYNKTLDEIKRYLDTHGLNINEIQEKTLEAFINQLESSSESYSRLIIFIKNLNKSKGSNNVKGLIKKQFKDFDSQLDQILKIKKRNSWVESFIENLELLINGEEISLNELKFGLINDKSLLFSSPLIKKNKLGDDIDNSARILKLIRKKTKSIGLIGKRNSKLFISLQRLLFTDNRLFGVGLNQVNKHSSYLNSLIKNNIDSINVLINQKGRGNAEEINKKIKELNIKNTEIFKLLKYLEEFKVSIFAIRAKINNIDFDNINYNSIYTNSIYTKKFLYNIIIDNIFEGDFIALDDIKGEKLFKKLNLYLGVNPLIDIEELIITIKNLNNSNIKKESSNTLTKKNKSSEDNALKTLGEYIDLLKKVLIEYESEKDSKISLIKGDKYSDVNMLKSNISKILLQFYDEEIVSSNDQKIFLFAKKIYNFTINSFDENLKNFILKFSGIANIKGDLFKNIDKYISLNEEISEYKKSENIKKSDGGKSDVIKLRENNDRVISLRKDINLMNNHFNDFILRNIDEIERFTNYTKGEIDEVIKDLNSILNIYIDDKINPKDIKSKFNLSLFRGYMNIFHEFRSLDELDFLSDELTEIIDSFSNLLNKAELLLPINEYVNFEKDNLLGTIEKYIEDTHTLKSKTIEIKKIIDFCNSN